MKIKFKDILIPTVTLFVICIVVSALLAGTNALTKDAIAENSVKKSQEAMKSVCPFAVSFEETKGIEGSTNTVYKALDEKGELKGFAVSVTSKGYGGDVAVMVGYSMDSKITGVEILSHSETPGLGANAANESFRKQFEQDAPSDGFSVVKDGTGGADGKIDAITGATITSNAVTDATNQALAEVMAAYENIKGGEQ